MSWTDKTVDQYGSEDWITASLYVTRSEYKRLRRLAARAGMLEGSGARDIRITSPGELESMRRASDTKRMDEFNRKVEEWQRITIGSLRSRILQLGIGRGELYESLKATSRRNRYGEIERLGFSFARQGIFIQKGAYRGFGGVTGSRWSYRKSLGRNRGYVYTGEMRQTAERSKGRLPFSNMKSRDWFNSVISRRIGRLADICRDYAADMAVDATRIYIKD